MRYRLGRCKNAIIVEHYDDVLATCTAYQSEHFA
jgi:hypothetical protein